MKTYTVKVFGVVWEYWFDRVWWANKVENPLPESLNAHTKEMILIYIGLESSK